ncbi:MAG TPA: hypothetical protein VI321_02345 [Burkholderiales bacterium]
MSVRDYGPLLEQAMAQARAAGLQAEADHLAAALSVPFTTSSEVLHEQGAAIRRFLASARGRLPRPVEAKFRICLNETYLAYPGWRKLLALIRRPRSLEPD